MYLRGNAGYGNTLQAMALTLTNNVNAAMNKNAMFLAGITLGDLTPCEGYIAKLQKRAAKGLIQFCTDLKQLLITRRVLYWDDTGHKWSTNVKALIGKTIKDRDKAIEEGYTSFSASYIRMFEEQFFGYLSDGWKENEKDTERYGADFERALLRRFNKYYDNYFAWMKDFSLPTTNNLSERSLRGVKSHEKISGQFESVTTARYHAVIKTYTETCRRNGINEFEALKRLCDGNPYTAQEIFSKSPPR